MDDKNKKYAIIASVLVLLMLSCCCCMGGGAFAFRSDIESEIHNAQYDFVELDDVNNGASAIFMSSDGPIRQINVACDYGTFTIAVSPMTDLFGPPGATSTLTGECHGFGNSYVDLPTPAPMVRVTLMLTSGDRAVVEAWR